MARKKKEVQLVEQQRELQILEEKTKSLEEQYLDEINTNPKYSLEVDPTNIYPNMTSMQKEFIKQYVEFKNVNTAAELVGIDQDTAKQYFIAYSSQQEIRRINLALYHRQFATKMLTIDELGGYLSSLLTGKNVPIGDQPKSISDKLKIVQMLIDLNKMKQDALIDPSIIMAKDIDIQIKNLSVSTIAALLAQSTNQTVIVDDSLTPEEKAYLETLPTNDLLQLIENTNKGGNENVSK